MARGVLRGEGAQAGLGVTHRPFGRCHDPVRNDLPGGRL